MPDLNIIYTTDADEFRLGDVNMYGEKYINDPTVEKLRRNCNVLRERFPQIPNKIGVVTLPFLFKQWFRKEVQNIEDPTTSYVPLDIIKRVLDFKDEDFENPLVREYVYRSTSLLFSHPSITLDPELRSKKEIITSMCILDAQKVRKILEEAIETTKEKVGEGEIVQTLRKVHGLIGEIYPKFKDLERVYQKVKERFEANKVSREFPLCYLPRDACIPYMFSVSLEEHIERDPIIDTTLEYIAEGCKASGMAEIPKHIREQVERLQKDRFGETKMVDSLDDLLGVLPEPKTLVTDTYIVDQFPQLKEREFSTKEFRLAA